MKTHGKIHFGRGLTTFGPGCCLFTPIQTPNLLLALRWQCCGVPYGTSSDPFLHFSGAPWLGWACLQVSHGGKEYLHHEGELIPGDFQQQHGLGVVLGLPLVLPQAHAAAKSPSAFYLTASTGCLLSGSQVG